MAKISYKEKDGITVYRVDRKIVCFRTGKINIASTNLPTALHSARRLFQKKKHMSAAWKCVRTLYALLCNIATPWHIMRIKLSTLYRSFKK